MAEKKVVVSLSEIFLYGSRPKLSFGIACEVVYGGSSYAGTEPEIEDRGGEMQKHQNRPKNCHTTQ